MFSISIQKYGPLLRTTDERSSADFHSGRTSDGNRCGADLTALGQLQADNSRSHIGEAVTTLLSSRRSRGRFSKQSDCT